MDFQLVSDYRPRGDQGRGPGDVLWELVERYGRWKEAA